MPVPRASFHEYDALIDAGAGHFSFCYEFEDPEVFARICPGKASTVGQQEFFEAIEHTAKKLGRGGLHLPADDRERHGIRSASRSRRDEGSLRLPR